MQSFRGDWIAKRKTLKTFVRISPKNLASGFYAEDSVPVTNLTRVAIYRETFFRRTRNRQKFWLIPEEFRLFHGRENARNMSEFRSEPLREKHSELRNFVPNHFAEEKNTRNKTSCSPRIYTAQVWVRGNRNTKYLPTSHGNGMK